jgi:mono/diheme cytochrome c family protein
MTYYQLMNQYFRSLIIATGATLLLATPMVIAQTKVIKEVPAHTTSAVTGDELYREFCAVCHGVDARGHGPAADALKTNPTDLTTIAKRNNGKYDALYVKGVIQGEKGVPAHGSKEMPSWGTTFRSISANDLVVDTRITNLVDYIRHMQR